MEGECRYLSSKLKENLDLAKTRRVRVRLLVACQFSPSTKTTSINIRDRSRYPRPMMMENSDPATAAEKAKESSAFNDIVSIPSLATPVSSNLPDLCPTKGRGS